MKKKALILLCLVLAVILSTIGIACGEKENTGFDQEYQKAIEKGAYTFDITDPIITLDESYETFVNNDILGMYSTFACACADLYNYEINDMHLSEQASYGAAIYRSVENGLLYGYVVGTDSETEHLNIIMEYVEVPGKSIGVILWMDYNIATHELRGTTTTTTRFETMEELSKEPLFSLYIQTKIVRYFADVHHSDPVISSDQLLDMLFTAIDMTK